MAKRTALELTLALSCALSAGWNGVHAQRGAEPTLIPAPRPVYEVYAIQYAVLPAYNVNALVAGANANRKMDLPMMVWLLKGPGGRNIVVDAGFQRDNLIAKWKPMNYIRPDSAVARLGVRPDSVTDIIISHIDWAHFGGAALFPKARIWIQKAEVEHHVDTAGKILDPMIDGPDAEMLHELRRSSRLQLVDGDAKEIIPGITVYTGGKYTFASQYTAVRVSDGTAILASDNMCLYENLDKHLAHAKALDATANLRALDRMKTLVTNPLLIIPGHDPAVLTRFPVVMPGIVRIR